MEKSPESIPVCRHSNRDEENIHEIQKSIEVFSENKVNNKIGKIEFEKPNMILLARSPCEISNETYV